MEISIAFSVSIAVYPAQPKLVTVTLMVTLLLMCFASARQL